MLTEQELIELRAAHKRARRHNASAAYKINAIILLGTEYKKPKAVPGNPDHEAQEIFS